MIAVLVMSDGRIDCLRQSLPSLADHLTGPVSRWIVHDDTGDSDYHDTLRYHLGPTWELVTSPQRLGFGGAYRHAYDWLLRHVPQQWIFSTEDDFVLTRSVDLTAMVDVLSTHPHLTQLALRRQPWNDTERAAGGIVESQPFAYVDRSDDRGRHWLEHRLFHTTNPSLLPRSLLMAHPWPTVPHSEGVFSAAVFTDPAARSGFWGSRQSGEWCRHVGDVRAGHGY